MLQMTLKEYITYRNSLFFRCKNTFVHRKCTKIFYANIIYNKNFPDDDTVMDTTALPQLLLPIVVASNVHSFIFFHQPSIQYVVQSPQLMPTKHNL